MPAPARLIAAVLALLMLTTAGCSAVELYRTQSSATVKAAAGMAEATEDPTVSALAGALADAQATRQSLSTDATESASTVIALQTTPTPSPPPGLRPPVSADVLVYGRIPIDSDRLNGISALAFDSAGQMLVSTRAGEIYRLHESAEPGVLAQAELIYADDFDLIGQVTGLLARGVTLLLVNDGSLTQLGDFNGDGGYESVAHLTGALPAGQSPFQANNSIVQAPDGRIFSANINSGEILQILLRPLGD